MRGMAKQKFEWWLFDSHKFGALCVWRFLIAGFTTYFAWNGAFLCKSAFSGMNLVTIKKS